MSHPVHHEQNKEGTLDLLKYLIENNQRLVSVFLAIGMAIILLAWPTVAAVLYLERTGYFKNIYQEEHAGIVQQEALQSQSLAAMAIELKQAKVDILVNREMFQQWLEEYAWQAKRTCINTAKTDELRDECTKPKWMRDDDGPKGRVK